MPLPEILLAASPQNSKAAIICGSSTGKPRRIDDTGNAGMDVTDTFDDELPKYINVNIVYFW